MKYKLVMAVMIILCLQGCEYVGFERHFNKPFIEKRIDNKNLKDFYGVVLYPIKEGNHYLVKCEIEIGKGSVYVSYWHDIGVIGKANSLQEIKDKYSSIEMRKNADGEWLYIGDKKVISREKLETHR